MLLPVLLALAAQEIPNTDTHFAAPRFTTVEAWEKRKRELRRQILFASGLDPMPERTPLTRRSSGALKPETAQSKRCSSKPCPAIIWAVTSTGLCTKPAGFRRS